MKNSVTDISENRLSSDGIMEQPKINQLQIEAKTWKRFLNFFRDENVCLKNKLSDILKNGFDRRLLEELENFQTKFIKRDELFGVLRNDIAALDKLLLNQNFKLGINYDMIAKKLEHIRNNMYNTEKQFLLLQLNFNTYLSENIR
jgi:hypothetical protein